MERAPVEAFVYCVISSEAKKKKNICVTCVDTDIQYSHLEQVGGGVRAKPVHLPFLADSQHGAGRALAHPPPLLHSPCVSHSLLALSRTSFHGVVRARASDPSPPPLCRKALAFLPAHAAMPIAVRGQIGRCSGLCIPFQLERRRARAPPSPLAGEFAMHPVKAEP